MSSSQHSYLWLQCRCCCSCVPFSPGTPVTVQTASGRNSNRGREGTLVALERRGRDSSECTHCVHRSLSASGTSATSCQAGGPIGWTHSSSARTGTANWRNRTRWTTGDCGSTFWPAKRVSGGGGRALSIMGNKEILLQTEITRNCGWEESTTGRTRTGCGATRDKRSSTRRLRGQGTGTGEWAGGGVLCGSIFVRIPFNWITLEGPFSHNTYYG